MNLTLDIGNTHAKLAVFDDKLIMVKNFKAKFIDDNINDFLKLYPSIRNLIVCSVINRDLNFDNYNFKNAFEKKTFGKEIVSFAANANKKEVTFWNEFRPVPLTSEETTNYLKKDSIQTIRKSQVYLDSIDAKGNKFNFLKLNILTNCCSCVSIIMPCS